MYIHIVILKVHVSTTFIIFIYFYDISKRKWFFFFFKIWVRMGYACKNIPKVQVSKKYPVQVRLHF